MSRTTRQVPWLTRLLHRPIMPNKILPSLLLVSLVLLFGILLGKKPPRKYVPAILVPEHHMSNTGIHHGFGDLSPSVLQHKASLGGVHLP